MKTIKWLIVSLLLLLATSGISADYYGQVIPSASSSVPGLVELATDAETIAGTATDKVMTPANITAKMAAPGIIGSSTPAAGTFTTLKSTTSISVPVIADTTLSGTPVVIVIYDQATNTPYYFKAYPTKP